MTHIRSASRTWYSSGSPLRSHSIHPRFTLISAVRPFHRSPIFSDHRKDTQHKDSLDPRSGEYSKSGTDDTAADIKNTSFNSKQTSPEHQKESARKESGGDEKSPLDVSPANRDVSRDDLNGGREESRKTESSREKSERNRTSGRGSAPKAGRREVRV